MDKLPKDAYAAIQFTPKIHHLWVFARRDPDSSRHAYYRQYGVAEGAFLYGGKEYRRTYRAGAAFWTAWSERNGFLDKSIFTAKNYLEGIPVDPFGLQKEERLPDASMEKLSAAAAELQKGFVELTERLKLFQHCLKGAIERGKSNPKEGSNGND